MISSLNALFLKANKPLSLKLEITNACNLKCVHCYARDKNTVFLDKEYIFNILEQAKRLGIIFINITGGECLLHPDFIEIYTYAYKLDFKIIILTNATLFTDEVINILRSKRPYLIEISIYGANSYICESVTGYADSYKYSIKNIKKLKRNNINILLKYILMSINMDSLIPFLEFAKESNLKFNVYYNIMPTKNNELWIDLQVTSFVKEILNYYMMPDYCEKIKNNTLTSFNVCNAGKTFFNINCFKQLYFCDFFNTIKVEVLDLENAINELKIKINNYFCEQPLNDCDKCIKTTVCDTCAATMSNKIKYEDNCKEAAYRYKIREQLKELRNI